MEVRRRRAGRVFNPVPRDTRLLLVELRCLRPDPSCTPGLQHCWTGLFTLACIRPAPLNSDQLPSCGVDGVNIRQLRASRVWYTVFPSSFEVKGLKSLESAFLDPRELCTLFPSFSASPRVVRPHRPIGALPPFHGGRVQPLVARKLFPRETGEVRRSLGLTRSVDGRAKRGLPRGARQRAIR